MLRGLRCVQIFLKQKLTVGDHPLVAPLNPMPMAAEREDCVQGWHDMRGVRERDEAHSQQARRYNDLISTEHTIGGIN